MKRNFNLSKLMTIKRRFDDNKNHSFGNKPMLLLLLLSVLLFSFYSTQSLPLFAVLVGCSGITLVYCLRLSTGFWSAIYGTLQRRRSHPAKERTVQRTDAHNWRCWQKQCLLFAVVGVGVASCSRSGTRQQFRAALPARADGVGVGGQQCQVCAKSEVGANLTRLCFETLGCASLAKLRAGMENSALCSATAPLPALFGRRRANGELNRAGGRSAANVRQLAAVAMASRHTVGLPAGTK